MEFSKKVYCQIWELAHRCLRSCASCGSLQSYSFVVCEHCLSLIDESLSENDEDLVSLWDWVPNLNRELSVLLGQMKYHRCHSDWDFVVRRFLQLKLQSIDLEDAVIIPAPSIQNENHALFFAQALAKFLNLKVWNILSLGSVESQKTKSKRQRFERQIFCHEKYTQEMLTSTKFIFVDDVFTTGATAHAAWRALRGPDHFQVWVLARRQLAGPSGL